MTRTTPPLNKRTLLGGQYWALGTLGVMTSDAALLAAPGVLFATPLVAVGAHLVFGPVFASSRSDGASERSDGPSKFLL